jgi:hypothetical protein
MSPKPSLAREKKALGMPLCTAWTGRYYARADMRRALEPALDRGSP